MSNINIYNMKKMHPQCWPHVATWDRVTTGENRSGSLAIPGSCRGQLAFFLSSPPSRSKSPLAPPGTQPLDLIAAAPRRRDSRSDSPPRRRSRRADTRSPSRSRSRSPPPAASPRAASPRAASPAAAPARSDSPPRSAFTLPLPAGACTPPPVACLGGLQRPFDCVRPFLCPSRPSNTGSERSLPRVLQM